jgi:hypothetical protein
MSSDAGRYRDALRPLHPGKLSESDAETILELAQLVVDADGKEDPDEIAMFFAVGKAVYEIAGIADAPTPTFAADEEDDARLKALAGKLGTKASGELAYAVAYLLTVADIELAPAESALVESLRTALAIEEERAAEITATVSAAITPPN